MKTIKKINEELSKNIPDITNEVKSRINWQEVRLNNLKHKPKFNYKLALSSVCCMLILSLSIVLPLSLNKQPGPSVLNTTASSYTVILDINPSIKFTVNDQNIVTKQTPLNKDAVVLLYKNDVVGRNIKDATTTIISQIKEDGLLNNTIKLSINDSKGKKLIDKETSLEDVIEGFLNNSNLKIIHLSDEDIDRIEEYYQNNKISEYEKEFISEFQNQLKIVVNEKIADIDSLLTKLIPYNKDNEDLIIDFDESIKNDINSFKNKYNYKVDINWDKLKYESIFDFNKDLLDHKEDLLDSLKEINEENDDYSELLEDLFEIVKDELFKKDD